MRWFHRGNIHSERDPQDPPAARDWTETGRTEQELVSGPKTGYEAPATFNQAGELKGELYGAAQVSAEDAFGASSGPIAQIQGGSKIRKAVLRAKSVRAQLSARVRIATRGTRKSAATAKVEVLADRLRRLEDAKLSRAERSLDRPREEVEALRDEFAELSFIERVQLIAIAALAAAGVAVFGYDAVVLAPALKHAGFGLQGPALTFAAIATPLAVVTTCSIFGVVAGAIALNVSTHERLRLAIAALVFGGIALLLTVVLLTLFRAEATTGHNGLLTALSHGAKTVRPVVIPWWFGPLQLAGAIASIAATAMYTTGKEGRAFQKRIAEGEAKITKLELAPAAVEAEIEQTHRELESATIAVHEIDVDATAAKVEVETAEEVLLAELDAEDGLEGFVIGSFRTSFVYTRKIFMNGGVWRVALETIKRHRRPYTPAPEDVKSKPTPAETATPASKNGDKHMTTEELGEHLGHVA
jgi:hypothetical protein